jgi:hypothetical protein
MIDSTAPQGLGRHQGATSWSDQSFVDATADGTVASADIRGSLLTPGVSREERRPGRPFQSLSFKNITVELASNSDLPEA